MIDINEEEEMNISETLVEEAKENRTREILLMLKECKDLDEAIVRIEDLLKK